MGPPPKKAWIAALKVSEPCKKGISVQLYATNGVLTSWQSYLGNLAQVKGGGLEKYWTDSEAFHCKGGNRQLAQKQTQVQALKSERARLKQRLGSSTSLDTLAHEARALGYVKPGERLFIVKNINAWRKRERASYAQR